MNYPYLRENKLKKPNLWTQHLLHLAHLFYPNCCIACRRSLFRHEVDVCLKCWQKIPFCKSNTSPFHNELQDPILFLYYYSKKSVAHSIIHSIKYGSNQSIARKMGQLLGEQLMQQPLEIDLLLPVPIHPKKRILRGYNQAECISKGIQDVIKKPILSEKSVLKTVYTETQTKKDQIGRWKNTENIFKILEPEKMINQKILIVDDVYTTGATYYSLKKSTETIGCQSVALAVLALTEKK